MISARVAGLGAGLVAERGTDAMQRYADDAAYWYEVRIGGEWERARLAALTAALELRYVTVTGERGVTRHWRGCQVVVAGVVAS